MDPLRWSTLLIVVFVVAGVANAQECKGKCVPLKNCPQEEVPDVDLRVGQDESVESSCPHYLDVCCETNDIIEEPVPTISKKFEGCGIRNIDGVGFRLSGDIVEESEYGEFPWTLLVLERKILFEDTVKDTYACVASLLAPNVALTVAHCVQGKPKEKLVVKAGEWDTNTESETFPTQVSGVSNVIVHSKYNKFHHYNLALLVLDRPFSAEENVQTICLPPANAVKPAPGTECVTGGWGKDQYGETGIYQKILKKVALPIIEQGACQQAFRRTRLGASFKLHETFMCAGGKQDADVCSGDGGAALACLLPGSSTNYYQAGVVAWGIGCGSAEIPGAYSNVVLMRSWIVSKLNDLGVDPAYYTPRS